MKKIMLIGNVGHTPKLHTDDSGKDFVTFSLGISVGTRENKKTDWVDVSCNGQTAELAKTYVKKGSRLFIEGFPTVNTYTASDGKPKAGLKVYANNVEFLNYLEDKIPQSTLSEVING